MTQTNGFPLLITNLFGSRSIGLGNALIVIIAIYQLKKSTKTGLLYLLQLSFAYRSTDPRDKIYALLGLLPSPSLLVITPRYDISADGIFRQATTVIMIEEKSLRVWTTNYKTLYHRIPELPSWCPDQSSVDQGTESRIFNGWPHFQTSLRTPIDVHQHRDPNLLTLRGKIIDSIIDDRLYFDPGVDKLDGITGHALQAT